MTRTKTPQAMYDELVQAIVKAVPEIEQICGSCRSYFDFCICNRFSPPRPITLVDCFLAVERTNSNRLHLARRDVMITLLDKWELEKGFEQQSTSLYEWFHDVLCSKE